MADVPEPTTEKLLRTGDELLDSSQELLRDLDEQLRGSVLPPDADPAPA